MNVDYMETTKRAESGVIHSTLGNSEDFFFQRTKLIYEGKRDFHSEGATYKTLEHKIWNAPIVLLSISTGFSII